jgi:heme peroxidase
MEHGSETYFVIGEGLLAESGGGRDTAGVASARAAPPFRFSRLGPNGVSRQLNDATRRKLAQAMTAGAGGNSQIPAGFVYLGQLIDHDLTMDRTAVMLGEDVSPAELLQGRSPRLDLDCLYGAGPNSPGSAKFYAADGIHLKTGRAVPTAGVPTNNDFDLPRGEGSTAAAKRLAVIADPRNDENLVVAQIHAAMIRFHNRVVDTLPASVPTAKRFNVARKRVVMHYQWMIRNDFLPRICAPSVVNSVFSGGRKAFEVGVPADSIPTMPIEFSVGVYRLGHSMIRREYSWNKIFDNDSALLDQLFDFTGSRGLGGSPRLPGIWVADFRRLFDFGEAGRADLTVPAAKFNRARRIDTLLAKPLATLPSLSGFEANLAFRNLTRAKMVKLATGQQMAAFLKSKGVNLTKLTNAQIRNGVNGAVLDGLTVAQRNAVVQNTPLWFYVLREAELNAGRLSGVGARIAVETFHRAMQGSRFSIVRDPAWRPSLGPNNQTFRMVDLLLFAHKGKKALLSPLGD